MLAARGPLLADVDALYDASTSDAGHAHMPEGGIVAKWYRFFPAVKNEDLVLHLF